MAQGGVRFYLPTLMRTGYFDIRAIAASEIDLTGDVFFERIATLIDIRIPDTLRSLEQKSLRNIKELRMALDRISCYSLSSELGIMIETISTSQVHEEIYNLLTVFTQNIKKYQNPPRHLVGNDPAYASLLKYRLLDILNALDKEEANRKMRVLVVDDAVIMVKNITAILEKQYKVYALTKPTVVDLFMDHIVPDLFLLDYKMPDVSGFDLVEVIRARKEHYDTPIVFLTSDGTMNTIGKAIEVGVCDYIVKPFKDEVLLEKIAKHIVRKKLF